MSDENVLSIDGLVKDFGALKVVNSISFGLKRGQIVGLLAPNGMGEGGYYSGGGFP